MKRFWIFICYIRFDILRCKQFFTAFPLVETTSSFHTERGEPAARPSQKKIIGALSSANLVANVGRRNSTVNPIAGRGVNKRWVKSSGDYQKKKILTGNLLVGGQYFLLNLPPHQHRPPGTGSSDWPQSISTPSKLTALGAFWASGARQCIMAGLWGSEWGQEKVCWAIWPYFRLISLEFLFLLQWVRLGVYVSCTSVGLNSLFKWRGPFVYILLVYFTL